MCSVSLPRTLERFGSHTTTSASAPTATVPMRTPARRGLSCALEGSVVRGGPLFGAADEHLHSALVVPFEQAGC